MEGGTGSPTNSSRVGAMSTSDTGGENVDFIKGNDSVANQVPNTEARRRQSAEEPEKPFFTRDFWGAGISGLIFLIFGVAYLFLNNSI